MLNELRKELCASGMRWAEGEGSRPTALSNHTTPVSTIDESARPAVQWEGMSSLAFDTHRAVKALCEAGAGEPLAEALVETIGDAMTGNVATKADIAASEVAL